MFKSENFFLIGSFLSHPLIRIVRPKKRKIDKKKIITIISNLSRTQLIRLNTVEFVGVFFSRT